MATTFDYYIDQPSTCIQHAKMVRAVLPNCHTRYVVTHADLSKYLEEMFGSDFEFNIEYTNDHWHFESPERLTQKQLREMARNIKRRRDSASS